MYVAVDGSLVGGHFVQAQFSPKADIMMYRSWRRAKIQRPRPHMYLRCSLVRAVLALGLVCSCNGQTDNPEPVVYPTSAATPLDENTTFTCTFMLATNTEFRELFWEIDRLRFQTTQIIELHNRGIFESPLTEDENVYTSMLVVAGTEINNGAMVQCISRSYGVESIISESNKSKLTVYGPPDPPTNMSISEQGLLRLNVSWTAVPTLSNVSVTYRINVTNLHTLEVFMSDELTSTSFVFEGTEPSCDTYEFSVTAVNGAGEGSPSDAVNGTLPTLPDVSRISESLHHSIHIKEDRVCIEITFTAAQSCEGYPVQSYYVVVRSRDIEEEVLGPFVPAEGPTVVMTLNSAHGIDIQENTQYFMKVIASNAIGNTTSSETDCLTTDVQYTKLSITGHFVNISCQFAPGSIALGCQIDLVPRHSNESIISHRIEKTGTNASEVIMTVFPLSCYDIIVYDWESDNTTGDVAVPLDEYWSDGEQRESCLPTTEGPLKPNTGSGTNIPFQTIVIAGGVGGGVIVIALFICVILLVICLVKKAKGRRTKQISCQVTTNWNDYPSKSMSTPILTLRSDSQTTQMTVVELHEPPMPPVYDSIQNYRPKQESITASEMEYNTLNRSNRLSPLHLSARQLNGAAQHNPDYAHLNQVPVYQVLECSSNPSPVESPPPAQPEYSEIADLHASRPPPPQSNPPPPQSRPPPPQSRPPPPQSRPPPPQSRPPPPQSKPSPLQLPEVRGNDYSKVPSAGTTIY